MSQLRSRPGSPGSPRSRRSLGLPGAALALALAAAAATAACAEPSPDSDFRPTVVSGTVRKELPIHSTHNIDLLFVIDNSPGMASQRAKLVENYRRMIEVLESYPGLPDVHIGVITTDVGTRGPDDPGPGPSIGTGPGSCTSDGDRGDLRRVPSVAGSFISDIARPNGSRERNYTGSLADVFAQLADVGSAGCIYARPLEAIRSALVGNPRNAGFLRQDAYLAVVLITNDDDCSFPSASFTGGTLDRSRCTTDAGSLISIEHYAELLRTLHVDPLRNMLLGAFAPPGGPTCADARPAPRLAALFDQFPYRSAAASICEADLSPPLSLVGKLGKQVLGAPCFDTPPLDTDPAAAGLQAECVAWYSYLDRGSAVEEVMPPCRGDELLPCWRVVENPQWCTLDHHYMFEVRDRRRGFDGAHQARAIIECLSR